MVPQTRAEVAVGSFFARVRMPVLVGIGGIVLVAAAGIVGIVLYLDASLERSPVEGLGETDPVEPSDDEGAAWADEEEEEADVNDGDDGEADHADGPDPDVAAADPLTVLVLGSDSRAALTEEERRELSTGDAEGERMESIALVRLDPDADTVRMLNIPRDTLITRCDGSRGRINAAYAIGARDGTGALSCVVQTITAWSDLTIDHVAKIDFRGFVDVVDTIDGVTMHLDEPLRDERANLDLPAGCNRLDGAEALAFARARHIDDDFGRQARQQRLVEELRREIAAMGLLDDPVQLVRTAEATARHLELDDGLTLNRIQQLAREHRETLRQPIEGRSVPGEIDVSSGTAFLDVDEAAAQSLFRWVEGGPAPAEEPDGEPGGHDGQLGEHGGESSNGSGSAGHTTEDDAAPDDDAEDDTASPDGSRDDAADHEEGNGASTAGTGSDEEPATGADGADRSSGSEVANGDGPSSDADTGEDDVPAGAVPPETTSSTC